MSSTESDSDDSNEGLTAFEKVVKRDAYKRALDYEEQLVRYDETHDRLEDIVDQMKLWVKNTATEHDSDKEATTFVITVFPTTPIKEIRSKIFQTLGLQSKDARFDSDSEEEEIRDAAKKKISGLKLIYRGTVLEDGKVFDDYPWRKERWKWSKPYAGVVWISPFFPEPRFRSLRK